MCLENIRGKWESSWCVILCQSLLLKKPFVNNLKRRTWWPTHPHSQCFKVNVPNTVTEPFLHWCWFQQKHCCIISGYIPITSCHDIPNNSNTQRKRYDDQDLWPSTVTGTDDTLFKHRVGMVEAVSRQYLGPRLDSHAISNTSITITICICNRIITVK